MIRKEAVRLIAKEIGDQPIISSNGFMSRDVFETNEKENNFYMIGSMGLASSIGLGIALKKPKQKIHVFDGDGNILMNLGSLVTIGSLKPKNLVHFIFDNKSHESTGGQPTSSDKIELKKIAQAAKFKTFEIINKKQIKKIMSKVKKESGPIFVIVRIDKGGEKSIRVGIAPPNIKNRFMKSLK
ncbi:sulfopyruvate decarboxylase subunit beta [Nitrosopumilus zosterae]|uniref:sulfopyruvate decarboxylase n=1 Tax=Nitrosopumilus zosterae TaxID=718286 RepID=A0A2S2KU21_9ARCH|nr:thiamine pyrophosphate-dependent enzyme [Nitrosopumilus zosterae]BDQ31793.1 thiamine pyrophosphate-dependent enzyme [Nitrosopumilus zosterae]GBH35143.1 sulfopyruvate decarboxylase subunit beta [Nitrosopumilus zosterae]